MSRSLGILMLALGLSAPAFAAPSFDSDVPADLQKQVLQDLDLLASLKGGQGSPLYKKVFGATEYGGTAFTGFFDQRIQEFGLNDCGGGPSVAACVIPFESTSTMWITPNYIKFNAPQVFRIAIMIHESRHTEGAHGFWGHATCPTPFRDENGNDIKGIISGALLQGQPACDTDAIGAYGTGAIFLKNTQNYCQNCNEKMKMDAGIFGDDTIKRIINAKEKQLLLGDTPSSTSRNRKKL